MYNTGQGAARLQTNRNIFFYYVRRHLYMSVERRYVVQMVFPKKIYRRRLSLNDLWNTRNLLSFRRTYKIFNCNRANSWTVPLRTNNVKAPPRSNVQCHCPWSQSAYCMQYTIWFGASFYMYLQFYDNNIPFINTIFRDL